MNDRVLLRLNQALNDYCSLVLINVLQINEPFKRQPYQIVKTCSNNSIAIGDELFECV